MVASQHLFPSFQFKGMERRVVLRIVSSIIILGILWWLEASQFKFFSWNNLGLFFSGLISKDLGKLIYDWFMSLLANFIGVTDHSSDTISCKVSQVPLELVMSTILGLGRTPMIFIICCSKWESAW